MHRKDISPALVERALQPLPLGSVRPAGWLLNQLRLQAGGLSGHLDEFWPDIANSGWIGGQAEGWERGPYWLDGVVPLAFLLDDERLKEKVHRWMDYILTHQHADGWLGPALDSKYGYEYDPWPVYIVLKALTQYYEATGDQRVIPAIERFLRRLQAQIAEHPLRSWARMRWPDLVLTIQWLYERTGETWLLDLAQQIHSQGFDWPALFAAFPFKERQSRWQHECHVANCAMALKQPGVWYRHSHSEADREAAAMMIETLDRYHGQATGVFTGDEVLAGKNPSQGTELCAVVEYMFSLEVLVSILGDVHFADRLERIAFNALPATFKPDMWAHQYDQQANQVLCAVNEDNLYTTNRADANIFGLEPHFGCCTANMHQGWPKFASHLWMRTADDGLAAIAYAPCNITTSVADTTVRIDVQTSYPFEETIRIVISPERTVHFPLRLRIPHWATGAMVTVEDQAEAGVDAGTFYTLDRIWSGSVRVHLHLPMRIRAMTRYHGSVAIERGPLVYALRIGEQWRKVRGELPHADWEVHPTTPWNYALQIDREHPERSCSFEAVPVGDCPFSPDEAPTRLRVKGRRVPGWDIEHNAAGPLPESPIRSNEPLQELTLLPYGCTNLRVTEFPTLA
jgi:DUF1680 family protein